MIAASNDVVYIHEPFNILQHKPGIHHARFAVNFTYINSNNEGQYYGPLKKTISLHYDILAALRASENLSKDSFVEEIKKWRYYRQMRVQNKRALIKDPMAVFSAEWLTENFDMQPIVLIRHPAAFAASLKVKGWGFRFNNFLDQPELMTDHLGDFEEEIKTFAKQQHSIVEQACLVWRIIYFMVKKYQEAHNDWRFVRHEDLSREPQKAFEALFAYLNLEFSPRIAEIIDEYSTASGEDASMIKRDSKSNILSWKERLTPEEIAYIRENVAGIASYFYSDEDWG